MVNNNLNNTVTTAVAVFLFVLNTENIKVTSSSIDYNLYTNKGCK